MPSCEQFQASMLEHLYGLLETSEDRALQEHVTGCGACQAAFKKAKHQQKLLAAATRAAFPSVRFTKPLPEHASTLSLKTPVTRHRRWVPWVAAAAVLLTLGGTIFWFGSDYQQLSSLHARYQTEIAQTQSKIQTVAQRLNQLPQEEQSKLQDIERAAGERQLNLVVRGPATVPSGAPSEYQIQTCNLYHQPVPAHLDIRVHDQLQHVVYEEKGVATQGEHRLTLPANMPVKPNTQLSLDVVAHRDNPGQVRQAPTMLHQELPLSAPVYVTHLTTDKPMYQPGEVVRFRSLTLDRFSMRPPAEDFQLVYTLTQPTGARIDILRGMSQIQRSPSANQQASLLGPDRQPIRGLGAGEYHIDPNAPGGEYTLSVYEAQNRFPPQERKFLVNRYQPGQLDKKLDFDRSSYGPQDEVSVYARVTRAGGGGAVVNQPVTATVQIDGQYYDAEGNPGLRPMQLRTDSQGTVTVRFRLPASLERGAGTLALTFTDGGSVETLVRPIPIVLKKLHVEFFPEGGDLIADVPNRVYFQVRTLLDKPGDLRGHIRDNGGQVVVSDIHTLHDAKQPGVNQGMGVFSFTPRSDRKYQLKIDAPLGIEGTYDLPVAKSAGVALSIPNGVIGPQENIQVRVRSTRKDRSLLIGAYCRGRLLDHQSVQTPQDQEVVVTLKPSQDMGGVCRVTVFEEQPAVAGRAQLLPLAERLIYRRPVERLNLELQAQQKSYIPGDRARVTVTARNEKGQAAPAILLLAVVDQRAITLADEKTARDMPTHFYLTTEVRKPEDLEYADFLLTNHPQAPVALDLLLGTQGWRRFAEQDPAKFRQQYQDDAERLLVSIGQSSPQVVDWTHQEIEKTRQAFVAQMQTAQQERKALEEAYQAAIHHPEYLDTQVRLRQYEFWINIIARLTMPLLAMMAVALVVLGLLLRIPRSLVRAVPAYATLTACAVLLLAFSFFPTGEKQSTEPFALGPGAKSARVWENQDERELKPLALKEAAKANSVPAIAAPDAVMAQANGPVPAPGAAMQRPHGEEAAAGARNEAKKQDDLAFQDKNNAVRRLAKTVPAAKVNDQNWFRNRGAAPIAPQQPLGIPAAGKPNPFLDAKDGKQGEGVQQQAVAQLERAQGMAKKDLRRLQDQVAKQGQGQGQAEMRQLQAGARFAGSGKGGRVPLLPPLMVREYAHSRSASSGGIGPRSDFTETLFWHPVLVLPDGKAEVAFDLPDSVTTFQMLAYGHTLDGRLGATKGTFESRLPFSVDPKTPLEVTANDRIGIPVRIVNNTDRQRAVELQLATQGLKQLGKASEQLSIPAHQQMRRLFYVQPSLVEGEARVEFTGRTEPFAADQVARTMRVVPAGFPAVGSASDLLEGVASQNLELPAHWLPGTLTCQVHVYPSTLAALQKGLEALLREPNGCFEQTSTSTYPNLLVLQYLQESNQARPEVEKRARDLLARGYEKLTTFECLNSKEKNRQGYEWFGGTAPPHEALTAYGLLEFRDMARVHPVDPTMLERTRRYLMSRKDGKGGFLRNSRALDTFGRAPDDITNAYIVWALTESGQEDDVDQELTALNQQAQNSQDAYFLALVANSLLNRGKAAEGITLLKKVSAAQKPDGHIDAERTSITGSGGRDLQIESTALAVLGWLKANQPVDFTANLQKAIHWIGKQRGGYGGFGSTQSTILALKALIAHAKANKKTATAGELMLYVGDKQVAQLHFPAGAQDVLTLEVPQPERHLHAGKNRVRLEITGQNHFPYTLAWSYRTLQPLSAAGCPVKLTTQLDRHNATEGETLHLTVTVENTTGKGEGMVVAIVGLPAGLTLPEDMKQLKDHARLRDGGQERGLIDAWETRGRELILYWRDLAPHQKITVPLDLICRNPGDYHGPASRAYLYYNADHRYWTSPLHVMIAARKE